MSSYRDQGGEFSQGMEFSVNKLGITSEAVFGADVYYSLLQSDYSQNEAQYRGSFGLKGDGMLFYAGEVAGIMIVPFGIACLIVLFKRFRSRKVFLGWGIGLLWVLFAIQATGLVALGVAVTPFFGKTIIASLAFLLIAYIKDILLWLKKEII